MAIKLLISDLDGTLLDADSRIAPRTAAALRRAQQAGLRLLVATGRAWGTAAPLLREAGIACDFVLLGGAEFRTAAGELLYEAPLALPDAQRAIELAQQCGLDVELNTDRGDFSTDTVLCSTAAPLPPLAAFFADAPQIRKVFAFSLTDSTALARAKQALGALTNVTLTSSAPWNLEITAKQAQKGHTARHAVQQYGLTPDEALVFGDSSNDESLFRAFAHTRAMGNADAALQALAERVIEPNTDHGVAREIERLLDSENY